eukprot:TRINITY_DN5301_c0_g1_i2.p1 TRINITY_DN5301_c0_g1~~TRINITY_DN5301_c0_g1_i2.p1  ORF type:complete len:721 (-),score=159.62 TRINITY_DN5301_c0_g1_i2:55-2217(-)
MCIRDRFLQQLELDGNRIGGPGAHGLSRLLLMRTSNLTVLSINGCHVGDAGMRELLAALPTTHVKQVDISGNNMTPVSDEPVCNMLEDASTIKNVRLAHNALTGRRLCAALSNPAHQLHSLDLSWNRLGDRGVCALSRGLHQAKALTELNLSYNSIAERGACVFFDTLHGVDGPCTSLISINISNNPIGTVGTSELLRLLSENLELQIDCTGCNLQAHDHNVMELDQIGANTPPVAAVVDDEDSSDEDREPVRNLTELTFELNRPFERLCAHRLAERCYEDPKGVEGAWVTSTLNSVKFSIPKEQPEALDWLPVEGTLLAGLDLAPLPAASSRQDPLVRARRQALQVQKLLKQRKSSEAPADVRKPLSAIQACAALPALRRVKSRQMRVKMIADSYVQILDREHDEVFLTQLSVKDLTALENLLGNDVFGFNERNPTGSYTLDMAQEYQRDVALKMVELGQHDKLRSATLGGKNLSQAGNGEAWRNTCMNGEPFVYSMPGWNPPNSGILTFDYSANTRPPSEAREMHEDQLQDIINHMKKWGHAFVHKMMVWLRKRSSTMYISCAQLKSLLVGPLAQHKQPSRVSLTVLLWTRLVDPDQTHLVWGCFKPDGQDQLRSRLGYLATFNPLNPETIIGTHEFLLSDWDQASLVKLLLHIQLNESGQSIVDAVYDGQALSIPAEWVTEPPDGGVLQMTLLMPEDANLDLRRYVAEAYLGWEVMV